MLQEQRIWSHYLAMNWRIHHILCKYMGCTVWTHYLKHTYVPIWTLFVHTNKEGSKGQACWLNNKDKTHTLCQWNAGGRGGGHRTFNTLHSPNGQRIYISCVGQWNLLSVGPQTTYEWKSIINSLYCSDRRKPNYGENMNIWTQVQALAKAVWTSKN